MFLLIALSIILTNSASLLSNWSGVYFNKSLISLFCAIGLALFVKGFLTKSGSWLGSTGITVKTGFPAN